MFVSLIVVSDWKTIELTLQKIRYQKLALKIVSIAEDCLRLLTDVCWGKRMMRNVYKCLQMFMNVYKCLQMFADCL